MSSPYSEFVSHWLRGLAAAALAVLTLPAVAHGAITVQGESPARANIPVAADPSASDGRYLALATATRPPAAGWFATYRVIVPASGLYRLDAVATSPAMADRDPKGGSWFDLSVDGSPYREVSKSEPGWADPRRTPQSWGSLVRATLGDVQLRKGVNTLTFRVTAPRFSSSPVQYRFLLDDFTLRPMRLRLARAYVGDPASNLGLYGSGRATVHLALNGRAPRAEGATYRIVNYFTHSVARGVVRIPAGRREASVGLPRLAPGDYRVVAALRSDPGGRIEGFFARLPAWRPVRGPANRFAATISAPWLLPPSRVGPYAAAMRDAGIGYVRDEADPNVIEPARGKFLTSGLGGIVRDFRAAGVKTLDALWTLTGDLHAPDWSRTPSSGLLADDLRDAYDLTAHLASEPAATRADGLEVWNEPDVNVVAGKDSRMPPDRLAAYVKATTLGITDQSGRLMVSLPGLAGTGPFQNLALQNGVAAYADVWAFHAYGYSASPIGAGVLYPGDAAANAGLRRLYDYRGQTWMTESGIFLNATRAGGLNRAEQAVQARYLVQATVADFADGVDKVFWFDGPPYCAAGFACFGLFDTGFQPWPSYSAEAAMTSVLGRADFSHRIAGLNKGVKAYVFRDRHRAVTVVWAAARTRARIPVRGGGLRAYDLMGARQRPPRQADGKATLTASPDPVYLVTNGGGRLHARPDANDEHRVVPPLSSAQHVVLDQRFPAAALPQPRPFGYRLCRSTPMSLDVYNFSSAPVTVRVASHAWGGWAVSPATVSVTVPARGRVPVPFAVTAGTRVRPKVSYPLVFDATVAGAIVPSSVSRILLDGASAGATVPLAPSIADISPARGSIVPGGRVTLRARVTDALSGVTRRRSQPRSTGVASRCGSMPPRAGCRRRFTSRAGATACGSAPSTARTRPRPRACASPSAERAQACSGFRSGANPAPRATSSP